MELGGVGRVVVWFRGWDGIWMVCLGGLGVQGRGWISDVKHIFLGVILIESTAGMLFNIDG